jgi:hypothetical protein
VPRAEVITDGREVAMDSDEANRSVARERKPKKGRRAGEAHKREGERSQGEIETY